MKRLSIWQVSVVSALALGPQARCGTLGGETGATIIEHDVFWVVRFRPELAVGRFAAALDVELLWDRRGVRDDDWSSSRQWVRLIRRLSWGAPGEPIHVHMGALDDATLGHGFLVHHYTNWYDEDFRRLGVRCSGHGRGFGGEGFSSSVARWEILGGRFWVEPMGHVRPALRPWRFGMTAISDRDPDASTSTDDSVTLWGLDTEFPLVQGPPTRVFTYGDVATILGHGRGAALGIGADLGRLAGMSGLAVRLERRFLGRHFLPAYIDAFYGVDRFDGTFGGGKAGTLDEVGEHDGWYGEVSGAFLDAVDLSAGFSRIQRRPGSGTLHLAVRPQTIRERWEISARLDKTALEKLHHLTQPERTLVEVSVGYRPSVWSLLYLRFRRTFQKQGAGYAPVDVLVPRLSASMMF